MRTRATGRWRCAGAPPAYEVIAVADAELGLDGDASRKLTSVALEAPTGLIADSTQVLDLDIDRPPFIGSSDPSPRLSRGVESELDRRLVVPTPDRYGSHIDLLEKVAAALVRGDWRTASLMLFDGAEAGG